MEAEDQIAAALAQQATQLAFDHDPREKIEANPLPDLDAVLLELVDAVFRQAPRHALQTADRCAEARCMSRGAVTVELSSAVRELRRSLR
ncbi:MAG: hypothetical protein ACREUE_06095, partial [Panacagrimonas sp.]